MAAWFGARLSGAVRDIARSFEMQFGIKRGRSLQVAGAFCAAGSVAGLGKLVMGLLSQSAFVCISGLYSLAMELVHARANMLIGLIMGACALMLGVGLVLRMKRMSGGA